MTDIQFTNFLYVGAAVETFYHRHQVATQSEHDNTWYLQLLRRFDKSEEQYIICTMDPSDAVKALVSVQ